MNSLPDLASTAKVTALPAPSQACAVLPEMNAGLIDDLDCCLAIGKSSLTTFSCVARINLTNRSGGFSLR